MIPKRKRMAKKIIIIGTRRRDTNEDFAQVWKEFCKYYEDGDIIVSGGCQKGGDRFAEIIAKRIGANEYNGQLIIHLPKDPPKGSPYYMWAKSKYERNTLVADESEENTIVLACVSPDRKGGTEDTLKKIRKRGKVGASNIRIL